jgi:hypothetical protein
MVTFEVARLPDSLPALLGEAQRPAALPYAGRRSCTCIGAAGEWIELIETG